MPKVMEPEAPTKTKSPDTVKPAGNPNIRKMNIPDAVNEAFLQPMMRVILHNDDKNSMDSVVKALMHVFSFDLAKAGEVMREAHTSGCALCGVFRQEPAELYVEQLHGYNLCATMEPE